MNFILLIFIRIKNNNNKKRTKNKQTKTVIYTQNLEGKAENYFELTIKII